MVNYFVVNITNLVFHLTDLVAVPKSAKSQDHSLTVNSFCDVCEGCHLFSCKFGAPIFYVNTNLSHHLFAHFTPKCIFLFSSIASYK